ncbi:MULTISPECIES: type 1 glutamine amidotransferase domain-containing protein [unclassified Actinotalea]|uniref:type 1 glutamine amidotransferase domain-containing protein n=1 Tax=unclassified Actinotalea TaxID=2638618 RepID=UPI0015F748A6|nr:MULTISPECIES: type 1 glutamine amidotransferase domain-containing protein [unclassified Actinotalea]
MSHLTGKTIVFLTSTKGVEEPELTEPWKAVQEHGGTPVLVAPEAGEVTAVNNDLEPGGTYPVDRTVADVGVDDLDGLVLPGGTVNADSLRLEADAIALVKAVAEAGKPIAAICHGPWALVEAGVVEGKTLTSYPSLRTDVRNAGGTWTDGEAVVCRERFPLVTSRTPDDLPAFNRELLALFE